MGVIVARTVAVSVGVFEGITVLVDSLVGVGVRVDVGVSKTNVTPVVREEVGVEISARINASESLFKAFNNHHPPPNMTSNAAIAHAKRQRVHQGTSDFPVIGQNFAPIE